MTQTASAEATGRRWLVGLLLTAAALNSIGLDWGLPGFRSWSPDDITPVGVLRTAYERFARLPDYPPVHYALLAIVYAPYIAWLRLSGGLEDPTATFPYGLSDPLASLTMLIVLGRLVSVAMGVGVVYLVYRITAVLLNDTRAALFAGAGAAFTTYLVLFSHFGNVDVPYLFWLALAFLGFARLLRDAAARDAVLMGAAAAVAMGTKEVVYSTLAGMAAVVAIVWWRQRRAWRAPLLGLAAFVIAYVIVNNVIFGWDAYIARLRGFVGGPAHWLEGPSWEWATRPDPGLSSQLMLLWRSATNVVGGMGWPMWLAAVAGATLAYRAAPRVLLVLLVPAALYYLGVVPLNRDPSPRYALPWILFLAPLSGLALARLSRSDVRPSLRRALIGIVLVFSAGSAARVDAALLQDARYNAETYLDTHVPTRARVETYGYLMYLPRLQERGYAVCQITPYLHPPEVLTAGALAQRSPDVIVVSSLYNYRRFGPTAIAYFDDLLEGRLGYRATAFAGREPRWLAWRGDPRLNPVIWVFHRNDPDAAGARAAGSCPEQPPA